MNKGTMRLVDAEEQHSMLDGLLDTIRKRLQPRDAASKS